MLEINNLTKYSVDEKSFAQVAKKVLSGENRGTETLSLAFIDKTEIKKLNKKFRNKDEPTDVLSFEGINEIVICPEVVKENSKKYGTSEKAEMMKVFIHGILHLLGYDHEQSEKEADEMEKKEKEYLSNF